MRYIWITVFVFVFLLSQTADAQILMPNYAFSFTVNENTSMLVSGKTELNGIINGIPMNESDLPFDTSSFTYLQILYPDLASLLDDMLNSGNLSMYPLLIDHGFTNLLNTVYLINVNTKSVQTFKKVKVDVENDSMVLGGAALNVNLGDIVIPYALSAMIKIEVVEGFDNPFFVLLTDSDINISVVNSPSYLLASTSILTGEGGGGRLTLENENGNVIWDEPDKDWIAVIDEDNVYLNFNSSAFLLPISGGKQALSLRVTPAEKTHDVMGLLDKASSLMQEGEGGSVESILNLPEGLNAFITPLLQASNGACVLFGTNSSINVNGKEERFVNMGLIRFNYCDFNVKEQNGETVVSAEGDGKLLFLGDSVYNDIPVQEVNGFPVPMHPIAVWILSIGVFIIFTIVLKKKEKNGEKGDKKEKKGFMGMFPVSLPEEHKKFLKWGSLVFYVLLLIAVFLLFDSAFGYLLGFSAFSSTLSGAPLLLCGVLFALQLFCMSLAYIFFGLPIKIAAHSILNYIGLGKEGRFLWRGIGLLSMWLLGVSYILYVLNTLILFLHSMIPNMLGGFAG